MGEVWFGTHAAGGSIGVRVTCWPRCSSWGDHKNGMRAGDRSAFAAAPPKAIEAAEGRTADLLGLRGRKGSRQSLRVTEAQWLAQATARAARRIGSPRPSADLAGDEAAALG